MSPLSNFQWANISHLTEVVTNMLQGVNTSSQRKNIIIFPVTNVFSRSTTWGVKGLIKIKKQAIRKNKARKLLIRIH